MVPLALLLLFVPVLAASCRAPRVDERSEHSAPAPTGADLLWTPDPTGWVTDLGELLSVDEERQLTGVLRAYRDETGHELAVLTVAGLHGEAIESFSLRVTRSWGLGRPGVNDGLLVTVAAGERVVRIEVGDGLTDVIPDKLAAEVIERCFLPAFRRADWANGLEAGLFALMDAARDAH